MSDYIWTWTEAEDQGAGDNLNTGVAPRLVPIGEGGKFVKSPFAGAKGSKQVDVVTDFPWTQSPTDGARADTPWIMLTEKLITANPMLNQIASNLAVAGNLYPDDYKDKVKAQLSEKLGEGAEDVDIMAIIEEADTAIRGVATEVGNLNNNCMFPYQNLYRTKDTGFIYRFPYFAGVGKSITNNFGAQQAEDGQSGLMSGLMEVGKKISAGAAGIAKAPNFAEPGSYIEQSKFFAFSGRENQYQFTFPLNNTDNHDDIIRNWQLVYLLTYQNLPNRMSRDLIMPPCIYEAWIPGLWYSKYAFISNMTVNFLGTRRTMEIEVPYHRKGDQSETVRQTKTITTIIPDAYEINITLTELVGDSQNAAYTLIEGLITTK